MASTFKNGIRVQNGVITFPDGTTQSTATVGSGGTATPPSFLSTEKWGCE